MPAMAQSTIDEMNSRQASTESDLEAWVKAFINFPTDTNRQGVIDRLTPYQTAWMDGRRRPMRNV